MTHRGTNIDAKKITMIYDGRFYVMINGIYIYIHDI